MEPFAAPTDTPMHEPSPESNAERHRFHVLAASCVILALCSLCVLVFREGWGSLGRASLVAGSAQVVGKWLIFVGAKQDNPYGFGPWALSYIIFVLDLMLALVLNTFLPQLEKLPKLGDWLIKTREKAGAAYSEYPKLRRMAWSGVMLWVFLPLPASGAVTGSFASRLVGLSRSSAVGAIAVGSIANGVIFAAMAHIMGDKSQELRDNWGVTAASALVLILVLWWGWRKLVKHLREGH